MSLLLSPEARQLLKDAVDVESLLRVLGFKISRSTSSDVRAPCIIHGGDNPTAFSVQLETKKWKCFTKKCELDASGRVDNDLISLVRKVRNCSFMEAINFLADLSGLSVDMAKLFIADSDEYRRRQDSSNYIKAMRRVNGSKEVKKQITEEQISVYISACDDYFIKQGFKPETLALFEVGSMVDRSGVPRATVPIRDASGSLVSMSARRTDSDEEPRYLLNFEFQKGKILYNLHRALSTGSDTVIIVEGFKALWALHEAGYDNVVACMGANISPDQVMSLCMTDFRNCLVLFDGDRAGFAGASVVEKKLGSPFNVLVLTLPEGQSPDDFSRVELRELVSLFITAF